MYLHAYDVANPCWNWSRIFAIYPQWFTNIDLMKNTKGRGTNYNISETIVQLKWRSRHIFSFFFLYWSCILEDDSWDVSVLHVSVMDQSSAVHKPASSLSVTQWMASDEWKFTASAHLSSLSLYNAALVYSVTFRCHMGGPGNPQKPANKVLSGDLDNAIVRLKSLPVQFCSVLLNVFLSLYCQFFQNASS